VLLNAELDPDTIASAFTLTSGGTAVTGATFTISPEDDATVVVALPDATFTWTTKETR
jgi:hypothetical protein